MYPLLLQRHAECDQNEVRLSRSKALEHLVILRSELLKKPVMRSNNAAISTVRSQSLSGPAGDARRRAKQEETPSRSDRDVVQVPEPVRSGDALWNVMSQQARCEQNPHTVAIHGIGLTIGRSKCHVPLGQVDAVDIGM
jgi:hypothetical protein